MVFYSLRDEQQRADEDLRTQWKGKRIFLDVSVLLAATLLRAGHSYRAVFEVDTAKIVLSSHVEDLARRVLAWNSPQMLGDFGDGLLRLAQQGRLERVPSASKSLLPPWGAKLSGDDQQVLADALRSGVAVLLTHDEDFFMERIEGLAISTPSAFAWYLHDPLNYRPHPEHWTYIGWFIPQWGSDVVQGTSQRFYIFEIANHIACYYSSSSEAYKLHWNTASGAVGTISLPQRVVQGHVNIVVVTCDSDAVRLFADGLIRGKRARLGPTPPNGRLHPFNSASGNGQIFAGVRFRVTDSAMSEREIRRLWRARTLEVDDGELQLHEMVGTFLTTVLRRTDAP